MKLTPIKLRIIDSKWYKGLSKGNGSKSTDFQQAIANRACLDRREVSKVLNGDGYNQRHQELISAVVGIPVGRLFMETAWFRVAAQRLKQLAACSG